MPTVQFSSVQSGSAERMKKRTSEIRKYSTKEKEQEQKREWESGKERKRKGKGKGERGEEKERKEGARKAALRTRMYCRCICI